MKLSSYCRLSTLVEGTIVMGSSFRPFVRQSIDTNLSPHSSQGILMKLSSYWLSRTLFEGTMSRAGPGLRIGQTYPLRDVRAG